MFKDYFIESDIRLSDLKTAEIRDTLSDLNLVMSCTPSKEVDKGRYLTYCRINDVRNREEEFDARVQEAVRRYDGLVVALSFEELWDGYERASSYFVVDVVSGDGRQERIPLSQLRSDQEVASNIARAPGIIAGGPDFQIELNRRNERGALQRRVKELAKKVRGSNELTEDERDNILGYLNAIDAILGQPHPDKAALRALLKRLAKRIGNYSSKLGERYVTSEIIEFIKELLSGGLPF